MKIAKVTGSIVSTKKEDGLVGSKLMIVRFESSDGVPYGNEEVAVDYVGAGIGATRPRRQRFGYAYDGNDEAQTYRPGYRRHH